MYELNWYMGADSFKEEVVYDSERSCDVGCKRVDD